MRLGRPAFAWCRVLTIEPWPAHVSSHHSKLEPQQTATDRHEKDATESLSAFLGCRA